MAQKIICNAKTRRVSVCNALDTLLVHKDREADIPQLLAPMQGKVTFYYNDESLYDTEFMDYKMNVVTVSSLDEALAHIDQHGSGHSEAIITQNEQTARQFQPPASIGMPPPRSPTVPSSDWEQRLASARRSWAPAVRWPWKKSPPTSGLSRAKDK